MATKFRLLANPNSPYVHKVLIAARELGIRDQIEVQNVAANPTIVNETLNEANPLAKIPALVINGGRRIFDSSVIVQYLDSISPKHKILPPPSDDARYDVLTVEALSDGTLDAALLVRYENVLRTPEQRHQGWADGQNAKIRRGVIELAKIKRPEPDAPGPFPLQGIAIGTALWYLDRRFPQLGWDTWEGTADLRAWFEKLKQRESWQLEETPIS